MFCSGARIARKTYVKQVPFMHVKQDPCMNAYMHKTHSVGSAKLGMHTCTRGTV